MRPLVLVADDHAMVREVVRSMLECRGYAVVLARDGAAAIAAFEHTHFDAALIDVEMPGMTGLELLHELRRRSAAGGRPLRAALITGVHRTDLLAAAHEAGASEVLAKPFPMTELIATVERLCASTPHARAAA